MVKKEGNSMELPSFSLDTSTFNNRIHRSDKWNRC
jgi:hypothetical protein